MVSEKLILQIDDSRLLKDSLVVSPNGRRVAYVARAGARAFVVVDGKEEKHYSAVGKEIPYVTAEGPEVLHVGTPKFSPDSRRVAYVAREGKKWFVVVNGNEENPYDDVGGLTLIFSPDSRRVAYAASVAGKQFVVVDGEKKEKPYEWIGALLFSPDSRRVAYRAGVGGRQVVVVDGKEEVPYDGVAQGEGPGFFPGSWWVAIDYLYLRFSPDSRRVAYEAILGARVLAVVDGKEEKYNSEEYNGVREGPIFSPNSRRVAYAVSLPNEQCWFVMVDGKKEKPYDLIGEESLVFSPDSQRVAYSAKASAKWLVVVDGKEESPYDCIDEGPIFSPDSRRVVYAACVGGKQFVVVDGKEEKPYESINSLLFSPDSRRTVYGANLGEKWTVVVDGIEQKQYDGIGAHTIFSPDSRRVTYWGQAGEKWFVVVDGREGKPYDDMLTAAITFDSPSTLHYLAVRHTAKGREVSLVEETIT